MKFVFALALIILSVPALAGVKAGTWTGTTADGKACSMTASETYFENSAHHPLNERIKMTVEGTEYVVGHPPIVDAATSTAFFNHDLFQGLVPTATGAKALVIDMIHSETKEGPVRFTAIENKWRTGEKTSIVCDNIVHLK